MENKNLFIGCVGWTLARDLQCHFPWEGTHLQRYAKRFAGVEINSSFYRPHQHKSYVRWAASVPEGFRFSVKMPKEISHTRRLVDCETALAPFLSASAGLLMR